MESSSSLPENLPTDLRKVTELLIRGREFANQLGYMLSESDDQPFKAYGSVSADDLVVKILTSFTDTLSILSSTRSHEVSQLVGDNKDMMSSPRCRKSEDSTDSCKTSGTKDCRGCYKRRKTSHTRTRLTPTLIDDGYAWRKYGKKLILNTKHPRNYYRCTHKFDQGCQATKQVQRTEDEEAMFWTTYHGHHTCKNLLNSPPQIILDSTAGDSAILINFESNKSIYNKLNDPFSSSTSPSFPLTKQEYMKETTQSLHHNHNRLSSSDYFLQPDLMTPFDGSVPMTPLSGSTDHGDAISSGVYSCTTSTHDLEMEMMMGSVDFDDHHHFQFEFSHSL